jgi:hypothetical protein
VGGWNNLESGIWNLARNVGGWNNLESGIWTGT